MLQDDMARASAALRALVRNVASGDADIRVLLEPKVFEHLRAAVRVQIMDQAKLGPEQYTRFKYAGVTYVRMQDKVI